MTEQFFKTVFENDKRALIICDAAGKYVFINAAYCKLLNKESYELVGQDLTNSIKHLNNSEKRTYSTNFKEKLKNFNEFTENILLNDHLGNLIPCIFNVKKLIHQDQVFSFITVELQEKSEEMKNLQLIGKFSKKAVVITNASGEIVWVNQGFYSQTGYTLEYAYGKRPGSFLQGPETDKEAVKKIREAIKTCQPIELELLNYHKNGSKYWINLAIQPIFMNSEIYKFIAVQHDITKQKQAEKILSDNQLIQDAFFNNLNQAVFILDLDKKIKAFNFLVEKYIKEIYGKMVKKGDSILDYATPDTIESFNKNFNLAASGKLIDDVLEIKYSEKIKIWWNYSYAPVYNELNEIIAVVFTAQNITEKIKAQKVLEMQRNKLADYAFIASHKLRQPLANIIALIELLELEKIVFESNPKILDYFKLSVEVLDKMIKEMNETITRLPEIEIDQIKNMN